jgi:uncharacterized Fe-S radical SAM superfamily protein PflX
MQSVDESSSTPKIQKVLADIAAQRDASIERVKALQKQNLELKAKLHEASRWKEMCEALEREREVSRAEGKRGGKCCCHQYPTHQLTHPA